MTTGPTASPTRARTPTTTVSPTGAKHAWGMSTATARSTVSIWACCLRPGPVITTAPVSRVLPRTSMETDASTGSTWACSSPRGATTAPGTDPSAPLKPIRIHARSDSGRGGLFGSAHAGGVCNGQEGSIIVRAGFFLSTPYLLATLKGPGISIPTRLNDRRGDRKTCFAT